MILRTSSSDVHENAAYRYFNIWLAHQKIIKLAERFPNIGVRVSIEGLPIMNDDLRGREGGFDRGLRTLLALKEMGIKDIGFGQTVSNKLS